MEYNRLLAYRQTKRNWDIHQQKVKSIKSTINTRLTTPSLKPKSTQKKYGQLNRLLDVQYQNKALLKKLTQCKSRSNIGTKSQIMKIPKRQMQNRGLLKRIQNSKASYRTDEYLKQHKQNKRYANIFSKYNYKGQKPNKTIVKFEMTNDIDKYIDNKRNNIAFTQKNKCQKQKILNRIVEIHDQMSLKISNQEFKVIIVQRQINLIIQITKNDINFSLQLQRQIFQQKYQGKVTNLVKKLKYNQNIQQFYLN